MITMIAKAARYLLVLLMALYTLQCFTFYRKKDEEDKKDLLTRQMVLILFFVTLAFAVMYLQTFDGKMLVMYLQVVAYVILLQILYHVFYKKASMLLVNNMTMLLSLGFIIICRIDFEKAEKQFLIVCVGTGLSMLVPLVVRKFKFLKKLTWLYGAIGIVLLLAVLGLARISGGASLSLSIGGITFQFSEFVKILFVFFTAGILRRDHSFKNIVIATGVAAAHVGILVLSRDLGNALVFFITYVVMLYVASKKPLYAMAGMGGGSLAAVMAYFLFGHVRQRVVAWKDPFSVYETNGYQIVQSLFAITAGGWFGLGLFEGSPNSIPVVTKDFIFAAICEELGIVLAICVLLVCMSLFLLVVNISMQMANPFYKLIAIGLGTEYAFQVFLTVGGSTKFIPMTGITLPFVSYGGSSVICSILMIAIIQGLYILRDDEGKQLEIRKQQRIQERNQRAKSRMSWGRPARAEENKSLEEKIEEQTEESLKW